MKLSLDTLGKAFSLSLKAAPNISAFLHILVGLAGMVFMVLVGGLTGVAVVAAIFAIIGVLFLLYCIFRSAYILNYMTIAALRDNSNVPHAEAGKAFAGQQLQVLLLPIIFAGIILVEFLIFFGIGQIDNREGFFALSSILGSPFFVVNMVLFIILILGGGIFLPIMIDQKKGAIDTIKTMVKMVKQQFLRVIISQLGVILLLLVVVLLIFVAFSFAGSPIGKSGNIFLGNIGQITRNITDVGEYIGDIFSSGNAVTIIFGLLQFAFAIIIISALLAYVFYLNMCLYSVFYLAFLKEHVNFNE